MGIRLKEGLSINKSLFNLTRVIHMLSQKTSQHIPYRNSVLTKILKSSLGGNARTSIIVCITPASSQIEQTVSSLKFGHKAMRVQQSARVQMNEMKFNALKMRHNLNFNSKGGIEENIFKEIIEEYETKIRGFEKVINEDTLTRKLKDEVGDLKLERDRLVHALQLVGDRTFFTKQMSHQQKRGHQAMCLQVAGDVAIQTRQMALVSVEQMMEEQCSKNIEADLVSKNCVKLIEAIQSDAKHLKLENTELRGECDRLEASYNDIIQQFAKMSSTTQEIMQISARQTTNAELANIDKMTDRELSRVDNDLRRKTTQLKDEREKR